MTHVMQLCSNFRRGRAFIIHIRPDEISQVAGLSEGCFLLEATSKPGRCTLNPEPYVLRLLIMEAKSPQILSVCIDCSDLIENNDSQFGGFGRESCRILGTEMETENLVLLHKPSSGHHHNPERLCVSNRKIRKATILNAKADRIF